MLEVKKLELPQLTPTLLEELGDFQSEDELREAGEGAARAPLCSTSSSSGLASRCWPP